MQPQYRIIFHITLWKSDYTQVIDRFFQSVEKTQIELFLFLWHCTQLNLIFLRGQLLENLRKENSLSKSFKQRGKQIFKKTIVIKKNADKSYLIFYSSENKWFYNLFCMCYSFLFIYTLLICWFLSKTGGTSFQKLFI